MGQLEDLAARLLAPVAEVGEFLVGSAECRPQRLQAIQGRQQGGHRLCPGVRWDQVTQAHLDQVTVEVAVLQALQGDELGGPAGRHDVDFVDPAEIEAVQIAVADLVLAAVAFAVGRRFALDQFADQLAAVLEFEVVEAGRPEDAEAVDHHHRDQGQGNQQGQGQGRRRSPHARFADAPVILHG